jgi:hypothetical protein
MRSSLSLAFISLLSSVVYGFSSPTTVSRNLARWGRPIAGKKAILELTSPRGGAKDLKATPYSTGSKCPATGAATIAASIWGTGGVLYILAKAVKRVLPIAMEPFQAGAVPLSQFELGYVNGKLEAWDTNLAGFCLLFCFPFFNHPFILHHIRH